MTTCDFNDHDAPIARMLWLAPPSCRRPLTACTDCQGRYLRLDELRAEHPEWISTFEEEV